MLFSPFLTLISCRFYPNCKCNQYVRYYLRSINSYSFTQRNSNNQKNGEDADGNHLDCRTVTVCPNILKQNLQGTRSQSNSKMNKNFGVHFFFLQERQWLNFLEKYCTENLVVINIYWYVIITVMVWIPLIIQILCYISIFLKVSLKLINVIYFTLYSLFIYLSMNNQCRMNLSYQKMYEKHSKTANTGFKLLRKYVM